MTACIKRKQSFLSTSSIEAKTSYTLCYNTNQMSSMADGCTSFWTPVLWRVKVQNINSLTPNDPYSGRTAPPNSKRCFLYIYSTNIGTEYFKLCIYSPFFLLKNPVCFIMLIYLFTFYIQGVLKLKKNNSGAKRLNILVRDALRHLTQNFPLMNIPPQNMQRVVPCDVGWYTRYSTTSYQLYVAEGN